MAAAARHTRPPGNGQARSVHSRSDERRHCCGPRILDAIRILGSEAGTAAVRLRAQSPRRSSATVHGAGRPESSPR